MSDIFWVTDYIFFYFLPALVIPFLFGILLIGMLTNFIKNGMNDL